MTIHSTEIHPAYFSPSWAQVIMAPQLYRPRADIDLTRFSTSDPVFTPQSQSAGTQAPTTPLELRNAIVSSTPTIESPGVTENSQNRSGSSAIASSTAEQRVKLMAIKYAGDSSPELLARLEILNQRLIAQFPRVTESQVSGLERAHEELSQMRAARIARARSLGLTVER
jgi:hypothetical protein